MKAGSRFALGLLLAFVAQFLGLVLAGAGHGWITPLYASFILWVFLPLTFATVSPLGPYRHGDMRRLLILIALGLIADVALVLATIWEGAEYFWNAMGLNGGLNSLWLLIWISWQLVIALALSQGEEIPDEWS